MNCIDLMLVFVMLEIKAVLCIWISKTHSEKVSHGVIIIRAWRLRKGIGLPPVPFTGLVWSTHESIFQARMKGPQPTTTIDVHDGPLTIGNFPVFEEIFEDREKVKWIQHHHEIFSPIGSMNNCFMQNPFDFLQVRVPLLEQLRC